MAKTTQAAGMLACDGCKTERRNLICHLTASGELMQLCPVCFGKRCMA